MSDFRLIPYTTNLEDVWDNIVQHSKNGNFLHLRKYMDYHADRFDEQSVLVVKHDKPVSVFPCNRIENTIISHSGLTYGGLLYGTNLHASDILAIFELLAAHFKDMGCSTMIYKAVPHIFHRYPAEEDLYALFRMEARLVRRDISSVIQQKNKPKLSDSRKSTISKAARAGIEVIEGDFFDAYHDLLSRVLAKFDAKPVHSLQEMQLLKSRFPEEIRLFGAFRNQQLLAGSIVYDFGQVAHTQYLASSDAGRETGALDYVLAHLVESTFSGHDYFSFGVSTEHDGRHLNSGLIFQKEGFGGRGIAHDFYRLGLI